MAIPMVLVLFIPFYLAGAAFIIILDDYNYYILCIPGFILGFNCGLLLDLIAIPLALLVGGFAIPISLIVLVYERNRKLKEARQRVLDKLQKDN